MKLTNKYYVYIFLIFTMSSFAQETIKIPDLGLEEALIDLNYDSNGLNGNILVSDAQYIVNLNINSPLKNKYLPNVKNKIKDLTGIEHFINLKRLDCSDNEIQKIDLSNNPNLSFLNCSNNKLTELNISNTPLLRSLNCDYNKLNKLVLGNKPELKDLYCSSNELNTIDISGCSSLINMDISNNKEGKILVSKNTFNKFSDNWYKDEKLSYEEKSGSSIKKTTKKVNKTSEVEMEDSSLNIVGITKSNDTTTLPNKTANGNGEASNYFEKFKYSVVNEFDKLVLDPVYLKNQIDDLSKKYNITPQKLTSWINQLGKLHIDQLNQSKYAIDNPNNLHKKFQRATVEEFEALVLDTNYLESKKEKIIKKYDLNLDQFDNWISKYGKFALIKNENNTEEYFKKFKQAVVSEYEMKVLNQTYLLHKKEEIQRKYKLNLRELSTWIKELSIIYKK